MRVLQITAGLLVCLALCGCEEKDDVYVACWSKASGAAIGTETCMEDQGFVFITERHLCSVSYPNVGPECYRPTWWRAAIGGGLRCKYPDGQKCWRLETPYLDVKPKGARPEPQKQREGARPEPQKQREGARPEPQKQRR
jgi:hypothetical protein